MTRAAPNFGHHHGYAYGVHIDGWGDGPLLIRHGGREWWFEFSELFGPLLLRKSDKEPAERQPTRSDDPFWPPFHAWLAGGNKCRAIWTKPTRTQPRPLVRYWLCHVPRDRMLR